MHVGCLLVNHFNHRDVCFMRLIDRPTEGSLNARQNMDQTLLLCKERVNPVKTVEPFLTELCVKSSICGRRETFHRS